MVLYVGVFAARRQKGPTGKTGKTAEGYFLANRSLGPVVFLLSLFGTNMTAFTILGSSGHAFANGIVTYGLMASSSALVIPACLFFFGPRLWALGKKHGFITPVQFFRDRWECGHIGTLIFVVQAALLVPYVVIGVMGGGTALYAISGGRVPYAVGGALVALVVMSYVFFGGMRGTAWVNTFQTGLFLSFGALAIIVIGRGMGGFDEVVEAMLRSPALAPLLTRERVSPGFFFSYTFIPLSTIVFPHISIFCLTAERVSHFKRTVVFYPLCILAIWLPAVFLGVVANAATDVPRIQSKIEARASLREGGSSLAPEERAAIERRAAADDVLPLLLERYAPAWLAGILGAGILAAVMATDSQILALSTLFTEDVFAYYGGRSRFGEAVQVQTGRVFVILITLGAYVVALRAPAAIFDLAVQYGFSGYAALFPLLPAAVFWKRSTKWGALAVTLWSASAVAGVAAFQAIVPAPPAGPPAVVWAVGGIEILSRTAGGTAVFGGLMPVVPMTVISALLMVAVSRATRPPSTSTVERYFPETAARSAVI